MSEHLAWSAGLRDGPAEPRPYARGMAVLPWGRELTRADLDELPEDGHRYELLDGSLLVTPAPRPAHQWAALELAIKLRVATVGTGLLVYVAPLEVTFSDLTVLQPDVLLVREEALSERGVDGAPVLAVEVLSPSTRRFDLGSKRSAYEAAGVPHYWVVDPDIPSLVAWRLHEGAFVEEAAVSGEEAFHFSGPVDITVAPAELLRPPHG